MSNLTLLQEKIASRFIPQHVRYWNRMFRRLAFWLEWKMMIRIVESKISEVRAEIQCNHRSALELVWSAYVQAAGGEEENPFQEAYTAFMDALPGDQLPLFICHTGIGLDIAEGHTELEAIALFRSWLEEDEENPIFGEYIITENFEVLPLDEI